MRLPIIGVMGSGREPHAALAAEVGVLLARMRVHLLTGGGGGVMAAVGRPFCETPGRVGVSIGVLPAHSEYPHYRPKLGYPNEWIEVAIPTHLPRSGKDGMSVRSRNHINVLASDAIVMLPGGDGTLSEARLALHYGKPIIAYLGGALELPEELREIPLARSLADIEEFLKARIPSIVNGQ
jgi:uncharacterized protein (TIGR00725 family)